MRWDDSVVTILQTGELVNTETGEVIQPGQRPAKEPPWFKAIKRGFIHLSKIKLSAVECAVFFNLAGRLKYGNKCQINQTILAHTLNYSRVSINQALKRLETLNIITPESKTGQVITYKMQRAFCWVGGNKK